MDQVRGFDRGDEVGRIGFGLGREVREGAKGEGDAVRGHALFVRDFEETGCVVWCADDQFGGDDGEAVEEGLLAESCVYERWGCA